MPEFSQGCLTLDIGADGYLLIPVGCRPDVPAASNVDKIVLRTKEHEQDQSTKLNIFQIQSSFFFLYACFTIKRSCRTHEEGTAAAAVPHRRHARKSQYSRYSTVQPESVAMTARYTPYGINRR